MRDSSRPAEAAPEAGCPAATTQEPLLRGEAQPTHEYFYWEFHERGFQQAVRTGDWKAVRLKPGAPLELYDLATDPGETTDVAARIEAYLETARTPSEHWPTPGETTAG